MQFNARLHNIPPTNKPNKCDNGAKFCNYNLSNTHKKCADCQLLRDDGTHEISIHSAIRLVLWLIYLTASPGAPPKNGRNSECLPFPLSRAASTAPTSSTVTTDNLSVCLNAFVRVRVCVFARRRFRDGDAERSSLYSAIVIAPSPTPSSPPSLRPNTSHTNVCATHWER